MHAQAVIKIFILFFLCSATNCGNPLVNNKKNEEDANWTNTDDAEPLGATKDKPKKKSIKKDHEVSTDASLTQLDKIEIVGVKNSDTKIAVDLSNLEGTDFAVIITEPPESGKISQSSSSVKFTYSPASDFYGFDSFTYQVLVDDAIAAEGVVSIKINSAEENRLLLQATGGSGNAGDCFELTVSREGDFDLLSESVEIDFHDTVNDRVYSAFTDSSCNNVVPSADTNLEGGVEFKKFFIRITSSGIITLHARTANEAYKSPGINLSLTPGYIQSAKIVSSPANPSNTVNGPYVVEFLDSFGNPTDRQPSFRYISHQTTVLYCKDRFCNQTLLSNFESGNRRIPIASPRLEFYVYTETNDTAHQIYFVTYTEVNSFNAKIIFNKTIQY